MRRRTRIHLALAAALTLIGGASCSSDRLTAPQPSDRSELLGISLGSPSLITCSPATPQSITSVIGPLGGVLAVGGNQVVIPLNAVLEPTTFTLTVPAS